MDAMRYVCTEIAGQGAPPTGRPRLALSREAPALKFCRETAEHFGDLCGEHPNND
jgi:hypothetical protein